MPDIPAGWLAIASAIGGAFLGLIYFIFNYQQKQIGSADDRTKAAQDKLEKIQADQLQESRDQRAALEKRAEADRGLADSMRDQNALILKLAGKAPTS